MKPAIKNLPIETVEIINQYLEDYPTYNLYDQPIEMDDLDVSGDGDIIYCYRWETRYSTEEGHGLYKTPENYNEEYVFLLTSNQLKDLIKIKENA